MNQIRRLLFLTFTLVIVIISMNASPANAILGLGKCEKIKKEVGTIEKKYFDSFNKIRGNNYNNNITVESDTEIFILLDSSIPIIDSINQENHIFKIWKIGTNNPKCFTNTQKLQIKKMSTETARDYVSYANQNKYDNSEKCKNQFKSFNYESFEKKLKKCELGTVKVLNYTQEYKSIYSY